MTPFNDNLSSIDERLDEIISASAMDNIPDMIDMMRSIESASKRGRTVVGAVRFLILHY